MRGWQRIKNWIRELYSSIPRKEGKKATVVLWAQQGCVGRKQRGEIIRWWAWDGEIVKLQMYKLFCANIGVYSEEMILSHVRLCHFVSNVDSFYLINIKKWQNIAFLRNFALKIRRVWIYERSGITKTWLKPASAHPLQAFVVSCCERSAWAFPNVKKKNYATTKN